MISDLAKLTRRILDVVTRGARTAVNGTVAGFDAARQSITVRPDVQENRRVNGVLEPLPAQQIDGVPVLMLGGQSFGLSYGVQGGDRVVLVYRHRSHNEVDDGAAVPLSPASSRRGSLADVVALPGFHVPSADLASARFREDGEPVMFVADGAPLRIGVSTAALALARAVLVEDELAAIRTYIDTINPLIAAGIATGGGSYTPPPQPPVGSVATSRVLVDA